MPPLLPKKIIREIQKNALAAHKALDCSGLSRTDQFVTKNGIYVLETNTIPVMAMGLSLYPRAAKLMGMTYAEFLEKIIMSAINKKLFS